VTLNAVLVVLELFQQQTSKKNNEEFSDGNKITAIPRGKKLEIFRSYLK
jgi:hypothetical protein